MPHPSAGPRPPPVLDVCNTSIPLCRAPNHVVSFRSLSRLNACHVLLLHTRKKPCTVAGAVGFSNRAVSSAHGAACAVGAILARLATTAEPEINAGATPAASPLSSKDSLPGSGAWGILSDDALPSALSSVAAAIGHPVSLLHVAACDAIGRVGAAGPLPLRSEAAAAAGGDLDASEGGTAMVATVAAVPVTPAASFAGAAEEDRVTTVQAVFAQLWTSCKLGETTDASRRAEAAAEALGRCCRGEGSVGRGGVEGVGGEAASARVRKTLLVLFEMAKNQVWCFKQKTRDTSCTISSCCRESGQIETTAQIPQILPNRSTEPQVDMRQMSRGSATIALRLPFVRFPSWIPPYP